MGLEHIKIAHKVKNFSKDALFFSVNMEVNILGYTYYNENPAGKSVGDCAIRAISIALKQTWEETYVGLALEGFRRGDLPNSDEIWGKYLRDRGFKKHLIHDGDKDYYTVSDFAEDHPQGVYILSMPGRHVVTVIDGNYYDSWESGGEVPTYFFSREDD